MQQVRALKGKALCSTKQSKYESSITAAAFTIIIYYIFELLKI